MGKNQAIEKRWVYGVCKNKPKKSSKELFTLGLSTT